MAEKRKVFTAEGIYKELQDMSLTPEQYGRMAAEFYVDNHDRWEEEAPPGVQMERQ
ncbi:Uncharacterised protein [Lacrimispora sphenoides]|nr:hypothetical protein [Lacrimispora sphenoides]SUY94591.1 Uncharacterised protein [Lacrimispora sphenoides]